MKNIFRIFIDDILKMRKNVIAWIIIMGLSVVPCLYSWFNIAACWDPYKNTGQLKVAIANTDTGYDGDLLPLKINIGDQVVSRLHENTQLDWVFTDKSKAIEGVKSGEYYASIIIPKSFSRDMMSFFDKSVSRSKIVYYSNQKKNAIAPKVTDKGASSIQTQINQSFVSTLTSVELELLNSISDIGKSTNGTEILSNIRSHLKDTENDLKSTASTMNAFASTTTSLQSMLNTTSALLDDTDTDSTDSLLKDTGKSSDLLEKSVTSTSAGLQKMLDQVEACYDDISKDLDSSLSGISGDLGSVNTGIDGLADETSVIISRFVSVRNGLQDIERSLPSSSSASRRGMDRVIGRMNASIAQQRQLRSSLRQLASSGSSTSSQVASEKKKLDQDVKDIFRSLNQIQPPSQSSWKKETTALVNSLNQTSRSMSGLMNQLDDLSGQTSDLAKDGITSLSSLNQALKNSAKLLNRSDKNLKSVISGLDKAISSGDYSVLKNIVSSNPQEIGSFLSAPVKLTTIRVFPVDNYGSGMAPFYTTLAIWVGGVIMSVMLKSDLEIERIVAMPTLRPYQAYFGRSILFIIVGMIQTTLICMGDLFFLGIQNSHPFLFLVSGWVSSLVYVMIIYTLNVSFGDVGKAIAVVLMVIQVAGSGGTFPIQMTPQIFHQIYPILPFVPSMNAMRECIGGFYGNAYWVDIGQLLLFLIPTLILGLFLRRPVIRFNRFIAGKLEDTKLM